MKSRNDFVSNSSSCSFILHVATDDDVKQLSRPKIIKILEKYAQFIDNPLEDGYSRESYHRDVAVSKGDFLKIDIGDDSSIIFAGRYPFDELQDVFDALNAGYGRLHAYKDESEHVSLGDDLTWENLEKDRQ